jgi:DNA repair protein RecN (Recombination protein N)
MLRHLDIRDLLIIDRLELAFQPGLNVLTGETGAGKSILLDALGFVLGWRGRADLVRAGAGAGRGRGRLRPGPRSSRRMRCWRRRAARGAGADPAPGECRRRAQDGLGQRPPRFGRGAAALSDALVELHGQQDDRGLLDPRNHRAMLDDFGGLAPARRRRAAWAERATTQKALEAAEARLEEMRREEEFLRHAVAEIAALAPRQGEEAELDARRRLMQAAEKMRADVARAAELSTTARRG